jgi:hypothetical protein
VLSSIQIPDFNLKYVTIDEEKFLEFKADLGTFTSSNNVIKVETLIIHVGEEILIEGTIEEDPADRISLDLDLISNDGWKIHISRCTIHEIHYHSYNNYLNFKAHGFEIKATNGKIHSTELVKQYKVAESLEFNTRSPISFESTLLKGLTLIKGEIPNFPNSTGFFILEDTYESIENKWKNVFDNLYYLLSFYSSNFIGLRVSFIEGQNYSEFTLKSLNKTTGNGMSIFYRTYPDELFTFLNSTYDNYIELKSKLNLEYVLNYYILMKNQSYAESMYLMGCILLETLKYAYAKDYKRYKQTENDFFLRDNETRDRYSFKDLIYEMFLNFDINLNKLQSWIDGVENGDYYLRSDLNRYGIKEAKMQGYKLKNYQLLNEICSSRNIHFKESFVEYLGKYRNEVVHTGKIKTEIPHLIKNLKYLERSIEILLLKILGSKCNYMDPHIKGWINLKELWDFIK